MKVFTRHAGIAAPFLRPNVDTDVITPLNRPDRANVLGPGEIVFESIRYLPDGSENPDFILNQEPFRRATILLAGENFGTGSSRESAVTGLMAFGFEAIIAPSYGGIFYNNCFGNGLMPVILSAEEIELLAHRVSLNRHTTISVDLEKSVVIHAALPEMPFEVDSRLRNKVLLGLEDLDEILQHQDETAAFQAKDATTRPWVYDWQE